MVAAQVHTIDDGIGVELGEVEGKGVGGVGWITDSYMGLSQDEVQESRGRHGKNEIPKHVTPTYVLFLRQFIGFMPFLIETAAIIALALQNYAEFGIVLCMLVVNGLIGFREEYHAKKSLEELSNSIESEITAMRDEAACVVPASDVVPGDVLVLMGGTMLPADCKWIRGDRMLIDTSTLTGEPIPRKYPGDNGDVMLAGTTVREGECYAQVLRTGLCTEMGAAQADVMQDKTIRVVSVFQKKIRILVQCIVSFSLVFVIAVILFQGFGNGLFRDGHASRAVLDGLSILIAALPIALPLVMQVNMVLGAAFLAREHHAIVTSLPALQDIASMSILCSDKTGTLTTAKMSVISDQIYAVNGVKKEEVLLYSYLCANRDKKDDPIDSAIVGAFNNSLDAKNLLEAGNHQQEALVGFNPEVKRVVAHTSSDAGKLTIAKGLVAKILDTSAGGVDNGVLQWKVDQSNDRKFLVEVEEMDRCLSQAGYKTIGIAICQGDAREQEQPVFRFVGLVPMIDPPREDTARTIASLHNANISVKMITGDHVNVGTETARLIGLGANILPGEDMRSSSEHIRKEMIWDADGFAAVLPSDKREVVTVLKEDFGVVTGMTGDGVNDAAALSAAQVGIAVQGSTDAAKNAADLILTQPGLSPIYGAVVESRRIFARIKSYAVYRMAASLTLVISLSMFIWISGCSLEPLFVVILALLNDISMIPVAYDKAEATKRPQLPRATNLVQLSIFFAFVETTSAMTFFYFLADNLMLPAFPTRGAHSCSGETMGAIWLHLLLSTELMIFSTRAPSFFWKSMPSWKLILSVLVTVGPIGCVVAKYYSNFELQSATIGWLCLYNILVFAVIDLLKVAFKDIIGDRAGETIENQQDEPSLQLSDVKRRLEKMFRYQVHKESTCPKNERERPVLISKRNRLFSMGSSDWDDGFVRRPSGVGPAIPTLT